MFHLAIKVESHLLKTTFKNTHDDSFYNSSRKDATKVSTQNSPSNFCKETTSSQQVSTQNPSTPKSSTKTLKTKCFKCLSFEHIAANCPNKQPTKLNEVKQDQFTINNKSENEREREGQDKLGLIPLPPRFFPSLSFSLPKVPISTPPWLKYVRDDFFIPPNGFHHLRGLFPKNIIIPKQIFPTWSIYRTSFSAIPLVPSAKSCIPFSYTFDCKSKLTLLYAGIQNSWANSLQLGEYDENQLKVAFYNEEQDHSPSHLKFFLLIFAKDKAQAQAQEGQSPQKPKDHPMKGKAKF